MVKPNLLLALALLSGISLWKSLPKSVPTESVALSSIVTVQPQPKFEVIGSPSEIHQQFERLNSAQTGSEALASGQYETAISLLSQAVDQEPQNVKAWVDLGESYLRVRNCDCAIHKLTYALQLDPQQERAYNLRAQAYEIKQQYQLAIADAQQGLQLDPKDVELRQLMARVQVQMGDQQAALNTLTQGLWNDPLAAELWDSRSDVQAALGRNDAASADRLQAQRIRDWRRLDQQANMVDVPQDGSQGLQQINGLIEADPLNINAYLMRANYFWQQVQADPQGFNDVQASAATSLIRSALRDVTIVIALDPTNAQAYQLRSQLYAYTHQAPQQQQDQQTLRSLNSSRSWLPISRD